MNNNIKTLVIHSRDATTDFLEGIYANKTGWTIIRDHVSNDVLIQKIKDHDRIVMLDHGDDLGLFGWSGRIINASHAKLLSKKICIGVWCFAASFAGRHTLTGFFTNMFISEMNEADYLMVAATEDEICNSNFEFAKVLNEAIDSDDIMNQVQKFYTANSDVASFNKSGMCQISKINTSR